MFLQIFSGGAFYFRWLPRQGLGARREKDKQARLHRKEFGWNCAEKRFQRLSGVKQNSVCLEYQPITQKTRILEHNHGFESIIMLVPWRRVDFDFPVGEVESCYISTFDIIHITFNFRNAYVGNERLLSYYANCYWDINDIIPEIYEPVCLSIKDFYFFSIHHNWKAELWYFSYFEKSVCSLKHTRLII